MDPILRIAADVSLQTGRDSGRRTEIAIEVEISWEIYRDVESVQKEDMGFKDDTRLIDTR